MNGDTEPIKHVMMVLCHRSHMYPCPTSVNKVFNSSTYVGAGVTILVPGSMTSSGLFRVRARARVKPQSKQVIHGWLDANADPQPIMTKWSAFVQAEIQVKKIPLQVGNM